MRYKDMAQVEACFYFVYIRFLSLFEFAQIKHDKKVGNGDLAVDRGAFQFHKLKVFLSQIGS